ncbi:odorant receptor 30a-like isoform X5 [Cylas formicarius]|uniref:odorant receptor 30a-like isoform X5 n=1 Tax=Cylas formicarius TaxID=197179 RepID=UPI002958BAB9|nr:odorant receptor 30a-like isoform X5 [Cylas formicarius]
MSNVNHESLTQEYFRYVRWLMIVAGIWKIEVDEFSLPKKRLYHVYAILVQMVCSSPMISYVFNMPTLLKTDKPAAISTIGIITFFGVTLTKMLICQTKPIVKLLRLALQPEYQHEGAINAEMKAIYEWHISCDNHVISLLFFGATFMGTFVDVFGDVNCYMYFKEHRGINVTEKPVLINYWYPFDKNKHYVFVLIDQNIRAVLGCLVAAVVNAFVNCIIIFVRLQLKLLQHSFSNFDKLDNIEDSDMLKRLCLKHQQLIRYVEDLNKYFSTIIFLEYMVSSLSLAAQILQITLGVRPFLAFILLSYTIMQLLVFAWTSNEIIIQSSELAKALFESDWYQHDSEVKVMVHVMLIRCQKPLSLKIGPFGAMDLDVGISICVFATYF